jgi:hypothetical protein
MMLTPTTDALCMPLPPAPCSHPMVKIARVGVTHDERTRKFGRHDRRPGTHPVCNRWCLRDECIVVERMEGSAGSKKIPTHGMGRGC